MLVFDTFSYAQKLQKVGFTEEQAAVQVDILRTLIENDSATKQDIADVQRDIAELRKETQQDTETLRKESQQCIETLRQETQLGQAQIVADLKKEIAESKAETLKRIAGMLLAQATIVGGLVKLL